MFSLFYSLALIVYTPRIVTLLPKLHLSHQDLEEELELDRRRVSEAEGAAKRAEEELAVAKERLLLQEDELQSRAGSRSVGQSTSLACLEHSHAGQNGLMTKFIHFHYLSWLAVN